MLLLVYGTLRKGEYLHEYIDAYARIFEHNMEVVEVPGVAIYIVGDVPGAKLEENESSIMELWEFYMPEAAEEELFWLLDMVEGVAGGLYERNLIDTHRGRATIYTYVGSASGLVKIKDWKEWIRKGLKERLEASTRAGMDAIGIRRQS